MGEVRVGDEVFDEAGRPCRVVATSEVFTDHDCYRLEFDDGGSIVADAGHRWLTFTDLDRRALHRLTPECRARRRATRPPKPRKPHNGENRGRAPKPWLAEMNRARAGAKVAPPVGAVRTTEEVAGSLKAGSGGRAANHSVRVAGALELPEAALPIPPYTLGAWLGDGKTATGSITSHPDDFLLRERIQADGFVVRSQPCDKQEWGVLGLKVLLRSAGVLGNKHIPAAYLRASFAKRLELLRGLMDTDGNCDKDGGATFNNTLEHLAIQVLELARSSFADRSSNSCRSTLTTLFCKVRSNSPPNLARASRSAIVTLSVSWPNVRANALFSWLSIARSVPARPLNGI
jgi:replicative DNA helicase